VSSSLKPASFSYQVLPICNNFIVFNDTTAVLSEFSRQIGNLESSNSLEVLTLKILFIFSAN